tara:strand:+ start:366 stop:1466 length:1101 start_codon:yes stop_codon:yes gene_type:complete
MKISKNIFGQSVSFQTDNSRIFSAFDSVLALYTDSVNEEYINIEINIDNCIKTENLLHNNPKDHFTYSDGFGIEYGEFFIYYQINKKINIKCFIKELNFLKQFRSIGFSNLEESLSLIIHEFILLPIMNFIPQYAPLHVSAFKNNSNGDLVLFGGTGGVGKTSLELLFCGELNYSFVADDMVVVNTNSEVYPNLSYPKIYAYNLESNKSMTNTILKGRGLIDIAHWYIRKKVKGLSAVRRSVAVDKLYDEFEVDKVKATKYFFLFRTNTVSDIKVERVSKDVAISNSIRILKNEFYSTFYRKIDLYEYNCNLGKSTSSLVSMLNIENNLNLVFNQFFNEVDSFIIKIPLKMEEKDFLTFFTNEFSL